MVLDMFLHLFKSYELSFDVMNACVEVIHMVHV